ncbi:MAG: hypothetical protein Q4F88_02660 [Eubacteriales bacterium]|nr:hypothetical protein [Eubacteriales bacterium]
MKKTFFFLLIFLIVFSNKPAFASSSQVEITKFDEDDNFYYFTFDNNIPLKFIADRPVNIGKTYCSHNQDWYYYYCAPDYWKSRDDSDNSTEKHGQYFYHGYFYTGSAEFRGCKYRNYFYYSFYYLDGSSTFFCSGMNTSNESANIYYNKNVLKIKKTLVDNGTCAVATFLSAVFPTMHDGVGSSFINASPQFVNLLSWKNNHTHKYTFTSITNKMHSFYCEDCGYSKTEEHKFIHKYNDIENNACMCGIANVINVSIDTSTISNEKIIFKASRSEPFIEVNKEKEGYNFIGFHIATSSYANGIIIPEKVIQNLPDEYPPYNQDYKAIYEPHKYYVYFKKNSNYNFTFSTSSVVIQNFLYDEEKKLLKNKWEMTGYDFLGWSEAEGSSVIYENEQLVKNITNENSKIISLFPEYKKKYFTLYITDGSTFSTKNIDIDNLYLPKAKIVSKDYYWSVNGYESLERIDSNFVFSIEDLYKYDGKSIFLDCKYSKENSNEIAPQNNYDDNGSKNNIYENLDNSSGPGSINNIQNDTINTKNSTLKENIDNNTIPTLKDYKAQIDNYKKNNSSDKTNNKKVLEVLENKLDIISLENSFNVSISPFDNSRNKFNEGLIAQMDFLKGNEEKAYLLIKKKLNIKDGIVGNIIKFFIQLPLAKQNLFKIFMLFIFLIYIIIMFFIIKKVVRQYKVLFDKKQYSD